VPEVVTTTGAVPNRAWVRQTLLLLGAESDHGSAVSVGGMARPGQFVRVRLLLVGVGGLGSAALLALARSRPRLTIADPDRVELSNLHRQILYGEADVGRPKVEVARQRARELFDWSIEAWPEPFEPGRFDLSEFDGVLDGLDGFGGKRALAAACRRAGVVSVFAAASGRSGQVLRLDPQGPCLTCAFPEDPGPGVAETCEDAGVFGPLLGKVASEQVRQLEGGGLGSLWSYDARTAEAFRVGVTRRATCPCCAATLAADGPVGTAADASDGPVGTAADASDGPVGTAADAADGSVGTAADAADAGLTEPGRVSAGDPEVDLVGLQCPATYVETRKVLERIPLGDRVWIRFSSDESARNLPRSAVAAGHRVLWRESNRGIHWILLERGR
jgi:molybdopterin/thiamine biosynthesis adenylyltransferase/TusA-related sulfurtransferase